VPEALQCEWDELQNDSLRAVSGEDEALAEQQKAFAAMLPAKDRERMQRLPVHEREQEQERLFEDSLPAAARQSAQESFARMSAYRRGVEAHPITEAQNEALKLHKEKENAWLEGKEEELVREFRRQLLGAAFQGGARSFQSRARSWKGFWGEVLRLSRRRCTSTRPGFVGQYMVGLSSM
jgi:hypothetical protein